MLLPGSSCKSQGFLDWLSEAFPSGSFSSWNSLSHSGRSCAAQEKQSLFHGDISKES